MQVLKVRRKASIKDKIKEILRKIDALFPYLIVGGGMASAMYYPEGMKGIGALLVAYALAKTAVKELSEISPEKAEVAEKIAETTEKALVQLGVPEEEINMAYEENRT